MIEESAAFAKWSTDEQRDEWKREAGQDAAQLAEKQRQLYEAYLAEMAGAIEETPHDWLDMRGDLAL